MSDTPLLSVRGLQVGYRTGESGRSALAGRALPVVHGVDFDVRPGEVLALVGESGSGKTTTGHAILGLLPENGEVIGGDITFDGQDLTTLDAKSWRAVRGSTLSLIPQDPTVSLDPLRRVGHQVEDVLRLHTGLDAGQRRTRVLDVFETVGFRDVEAVYRRYPHELSGGMRQRVLIAAAVIAEPDLIVADEPTSGLDATVQKQVLDLIDELRIRSSTAVVLVTHDLGVAADRADTLAVMRAGRVVESGPTAQVVAEPAHEYTRSLLHAVRSRSVRRPTRIASLDDSLSADAAIEVDALTKTFGDVAAVDGISFRVSFGQTFSIVGESGSGKSTTARILSGLTRPTSGGVRVLGSETSGYSRRDFRPLRRAVQIVYQNPYASFDPRFDVFDVVEEPLRAFAPARFWRHGRERPGRERHRDRVAAALESAALSPDLIDRHPRELSGGQRQRVAIARALVGDPSVLILDEPISALDVSVAAQILELLQTLQDERGLTYVFISHDLAVVSAISDEVAVMQNGRIVEQGSVGRIFDAPREDYTIRLLDAIAGRDLHTVGACQ
ncbi:dipeptide ABC transporter ATP-binding protein [Gordonia humi]|uniref:Peptide/nickel transport system ATP-binding protein n=1 Tax=Gordonia humi TaxID=686429 RepID=A0A840F575_9ACTN|nr:ABC transporter ATP-binding protein [Gordonia humi]MBB4135410.1 peptide/nickel transport system ATP-binding protein [Gordonia humi]